MNNYLVYTHNHNIKWEMNTGSMLIIEFVFLLLSSFKITAKTNKKNPKGRSIKLNSISSDDFFNFFLDQFEKIISELEINITSTSHAANITKACYLMA